MAIKKLSCPLMDAEIDEGICYEGVRNSRL